LGARKKIGNVNKVKLTIQGERGRGLTPSSVGKGTEKMENRDSKLSQGAGVSWMLGDVMV